MISRQESLRTCLEEIGKVQFLDQEEITRYSQGIGVQEFQSFINKLQIGNPATIQRLRYLLVLEKEEEQEENGFMTDVQEEYLKRVYKEVQDVNESFSYKHIETLQLIAFVLEHTPRYDANYVRLIEQGNILRELQLLQQALKEQFSQKDFGSKFRIIREDPRDSKELSSFIKTITSVVKVIQVNRLSDSSAKIANCSKKVMGKEGVVFVGVTGSGKTTTILACLGHEMVKKRWKGQPFVTPKQLFSEDPDIKNLVANAGSVSVTRNVTAIELQKNMKPSFQDQTILLLDTPGFNDTAGPTVDLTNSYSSTLAVRSLGSARFVIVISSKDMGSRFQGITEIVLILDSLFPNYENIKPAVYFLFNRFTSAELKSLADIAPDIYKKIEEHKKTDNLKEIFKDLASKINIFGEKLIFDPTGKPVSYSKSCIQSILGFGKIKDLFNLFPIVNSQKALQKIKNQFAIYEGLIRYYFDKKQFKICKYFMHQIERFQSFFKCDVVPSVVTEAVQKIKKTTSTVLDVRYTHLIQTMNSAIDSSSATWQLIKVYQDQMNIYQQIRQLRSIVNLDGQNRLKKNLDDKLTMAINGLKGEYTKRDSRYVESLFTVFQIETCKHLLKQITTFFETQFQTVLAEYITSVRDFKQKEMIQNYRRCILIRSFLNIFLQQQTDSAEVDMVVIGVIKEKADSIRPLIENLKDCNEQGYSRMKEVSEYLLGMQYSHQYLLNVSNKELIKEMLSQSRGLFTTHISDGLRSIIPYLDCQEVLNQVVKNKLKHIYDQRKKLKQIPHLTGVVEQVFIEIENRVENIFQRETNNLQTLLKKIFEEKLITGEVVRRIKEVDKAAYKLEVANEFVNHSFVIDREEIDEKIEDFLGDLITNIQDIAKSRPCHSLFQTDDNQIDLIKRISMILSLFHPLTIQPVSPISTATSILKSKLLKKPQFIAEYTIAIDKFKSILQMYVKYAKQLQLQLTDSLDKMKRDQIRPMRENKIRQISNCLSFIQKIEYNCNSFYEPSLKVYQEFSTVFKQWTSESEGAVKKKISTISGWNKEVSNQEKSLVKSLGCLIRNLKTTDQQTRSFHFGNVEGQLLDLIASFRDSYYHTLQPQNSITQLKIFYSQCLVLSELDTYISSKTQFQDLANSAKKRVENMNKNIDEKFNQYFNSVPMCVRSVSECLEEMNQVKHPRFKDFQDVFCKVMISRIQRMRRARSLRNLPSEQIYKYLDQFIKLDDDGKIVGSSCINESAIGITLSADLKSLRQKIRQEVESLMSEAEKSIQTNLEFNHIQEALQFVDFLHTVDKLLEHSSICRKSRANELKQRIDQYLTRFKTCPKENLQHFDTIFHVKPTGICKNLIEIWKTMEKYIDSEVRRIRSLLENKNDFDQKLYNQIIDFSDMLPSKFKTVGDQLKKCIRQKREKASQDKINLETEIRYIEVFVNKTLNLRIVDMFEKNELNEENKKKVLDKIESVLSRKMASVDKMETLDKLIRAFDSELIVVFYNKLHDNIPQPILEKYDNTKKLIAKKLKQLINNQLETILNSLGKDRHDTMFRQHSRMFLCKKSICELVVNTERIFDFENTDELKEAVSKETTKKVKTLFDQIKKMHESMKTKVDELKQIMNAKETHQSIMSSIEDVKQIGLIEDLLQTLLDKCQSSMKNNLNPITLLSEEEIRQVQKSFIFKKYKQTGEREIMQRLEGFKRFSLYLESYNIKSKQDITEWFQENKCQTRYFQSYLDLILRALGVEYSFDITNQIEGQKTNIQSEFQQMTSEILEYANNPTISARAFEQVMGKLLILETYSKFNNLNYNPVPKFYLKIEEQHKFYHSKANDCLNHLSAGLSLFNSTQATHQSSEKQRLESEKERLETQFQMAKERIETECASKCNGASEQTIETLNKQKDGLIIESKNRKQEEIYTIKSQIEEQFNARKNVFDQNVKKSMIVVAEQLARMVGITYNLKLGLKQKEQKSREDGVIKEVKRIGKRLWLRFLMENLRQIDSPFVERLLIENQNLKELGDTNFKKNIAAITLQQAISQLLKLNISLKQAYRNRLENIYILYSQVYKKWTQAYKLQKNEVQNDLIKELHKSGMISCGKQLNVERIAQIFALWTMLTSAEEQGTVYFNYQPHVLQVITIFLLIGLQNLSLEVNKFAEIHTGQGKSLILAVLSTYLALNGLEVDCVCYSDYLSKRDYETFLPLFKSLGIELKINYCTFSGLTQTYLKYQNTSLRSLAEEVARGNLNSANFINQIKNLVSPNMYQERRPNRALLIDQADVFFIDEFYGNTYNPAINIKSVKIKNLYQEIWSKRSEKNNLKGNIYRSTAFKEVIEEFPHINNLLTNHLDYIIAEAQQYQHQYQIIDYRIVYKDQDTYTDKISYGYKTIFANFYELSRGTINELPLAACSFSFTLCNLSYAELPKTYGSIYGVTGTLKNLSVHKKNIIQSQYKVKQNYLIPSVYQVSNRDDKGYVIVQQNQHYRSIVQNFRPLVEVFGKSRPIMIFFNSFEDLMNFMKSDQFMPYTNKVSILSEKLDPSERKDRIYRSTFSEKISLITRSFVRGTDFIIYEKNVIQNGGAHMICTFVMEQKSEEVQALGRVCRQGDPGSSTFIVTAQELENKLKIDNVRNIPQRDIQSMIDEAREKVVFEQRDKLADLVLKCKKEHDDSIALFSHLLSKNFDIVWQAIEKNNQIQTLLYSCRSKTILAIDATGSMSESLKQIKKCLPECFNRVYQILKQNNVQKGFEVQVAIYRNYNVEKADLFKTSSFSSIPQPLIQFIKTISPDGGWGNEALQIVFDHCLSVQELKQVIVLTDAQPNTKQEVIQKRNNTQHGFGWTYWNQSKKYSQPLNVQELIPAMKTKGIAVHSLPIGSPTVIAYYQNLSKQLGGNCEAFDPVSKSATTQLTDFISLAILERIGTSSEGGALVNSYKKTYNA